MTSKVTFSNSIGYEALFGMVVVIEWQVVTDDKFYEMGPWCLKSLGGPHKEWFHKTKNKKMKKKKKQ